MIVGNAAQSGKFETLWITCTALGRRYSALFSKKGFRKSVLAMEEPEHEQNDSGLGLLGTLPAEIRLSIFEEVLEIDRPITTRKCCGVLSKSVNLCQYHAHVQKYPKNAGRRDRSRFALLTVSRAVKHAALWVLHNKIKVHAELTTLLWVGNPHPIDVYHRAFKRIWCSVTRFRLLELSLPSDTTGYTLICLSEGIDQLFECWDKHDMHAAEPLREVTIQLGKMFDADQVREHPTCHVSWIGLERIWEALEQSVQLIVVKDRKVKWVFTVTSGIKARSALGQKYLNRFQELLGKVDIGFEGESSAHEIEGRSATGGTHRRFLD